MPVTYEPCQRCASCRGPAHPATGAQYTPAILVCGPCERAFWAWAKDWTRRPKRLKGGGLVYFYEAARRC